MQLLRGLTSLENESYKLVFPQRNIPTQLSLDMILVTDFDEFGYISEGWSFRITFFSRCSHPKTF